MCYIKRIFTTFAQNLFGTLCTEAKNETLIPIIITMKKYNFNAGPSILPREVIEATAQACLDFNGSGLSLMEISHRAKDFQPVVDETVALFKELLNIPEGYSVIFLGGGASLL